MLTIPKTLSGRFYHWEQRLKGKGEVFPYLEQIKSNQHAPAEELQSMQWQKLIQLLRHAEKTVPFYREIFKAQKIEIEEIRTYEDFLQIPILTKDVIRSNRDQMISEDFPRSELVENFSSGSTGRPLSFFQTRQFNIYAKAHQLRNYGWCGYEIGDRFSLLWGSELYFKSKQVIDKFENFLINRIELNTFKLSESIILDYIERLRQFQPILVSTYPSSIYLIGKVLEKYNLPQLTLPCIQTTSEVLTPNLRDFIASQFDAKVYDKYGSRETNVIAHECPNHEGMHINVENTFVEFLKDGKPVSSGETGEIVVTNLNNLGMPLIRYRMDDLASPLKGKCSCGITLPRMGGLKGRKSDMIRTTDGSYVDSYLFSFILMRYQEINTFQVIQEAVERLTVRLQMSSKARPNFEQEIRELIHKFSDPNFKVLFEYLEEVPISNSGKHRTTISYVTDQDSAIFKA